jgi:proliferating cell nuclear antigen
MKLTLAEPKYLKESITIISDLVNEARFKITTEGIELVAMDPANVAMVMFNLFSSSFTEYIIKKDMEIAINLSNLKQILRRVGTNDMLTLEVTEENKLKITIQGNSKRTFSIPLIEIDEKPQKIPDLKFGVKITTQASILNNAIEDVDIVAEAVTFLADKNFIVQAEGDLSKAKIEIPVDEHTKLEKEGADPIKAKYSIEYMKKIISASKISDTVDLSFNKDYPLKVEYKIVDRVALSFILAPRVEND